MHIEWDAVRTFLAVVESRSMSEAARQLRVGQPTVSRRLAQLEEQLGYPLFRRTVAGASLTAAGERLVEPARRMAEWAGEVDRAALAGDRRPFGVVRLTAPPGVAWDFVAPFAAWLKRREPALQIELLTSIQYLDLARGEADLALRIRPAGAELTTLATLPHSNAVFASRAYAAKLPRRYGIADLDWITWAPPYDQLPPNPQLERLIPGFRPALSCDNFLVMRRAAEAGLGAIALMDVRHRFAAPTNLVKLKLDLGRQGESALYLVCAKRAMEIPRVRVVAELLIEELGKLAATSRTSTSTGS